MTTKKVLLATNSEHGQANVFLAVGHALQALDKDVEIHFVSFKPIAKDVASSSEYSVKCTPGAAPWTFHLLDGPDWLTAAHSKDGMRDTMERLMKTRPKFGPIMSVLKIINTLLMPFDEAEFEQIYKSMARIIDQVQPDITAVDNLFTPGLTVCRALGVKHLVLSPNTLRDFSVMFQPRGAYFWKYPALCSAFKYPVPLRKIPANITYILAQIYFSLTDKRLRAVRKKIQEKLGADLVTFDQVVMRPPPGLKILVSNRPEVEFPLVIPPHLKACGPVIRPVPSVAEEDAELDAWLRRGPTVFICLGTHRYLDEPEAVAMAGALRVLLDAVEAWESTVRGGRGDGSDSSSDATIGGVPGKLQVLWKLRRNKLKETAPLYEVVPGNKVYEILKPEIEAGRVRILDWLNPQPSAVLQVGTVVCSVNHGGANSFHDAVTCGVPQVTLPAWLDCYDFANRTEYLGIGRWGNRKAAPTHTQAELGPILVDVVLGPRAAEMRARVRDLADLCAKTPGTTVAASSILEEIKANKEGKEDKEDKENKA